MCEDNQRQWCEWLDVTLGDMKIRSTAIMYFTSTLLPYNLFTLHMVNSISKSEPFIVTGVSLDTN